ncbi:MAG: hypothetical protein K2L95_04745, partial [Alphaproteobacteria bacterium]|nr:hypothetical protein [Alphaproteobacteria bacterium]
INALDSCMQDDFVCGSDYENCLDPTGKYIVNGEIVVGGTPGVSGGELSSSTSTHTGLYSTWNYKADNANKNAWGNGTLADYIDANVTSSFYTGDANNMAIYLQKKIGWVDSDGRNQGMCMSVLNKCQDVTYTGNTGNKKYNPTNEVVKQYLARTLVQIKAAQDEVLADHAETCISDVASCLAQNNYTANLYGSQTVTGNANPSDVAIRACMSVINTCKSVTERSAATTTVYDWLNQALGTNYNKS